MKRLIVIALALFSMQMAFADGTANINIKLKGALNDNRYFLCLPNIGCLSVLAAKHGKVYPVIRDFTVRGIFIADASQSLRVSPQVMPASCNVSVKENQTITIAGSIVPGLNNTVVVKNLHCSVN